MNFEVNDMFRILTFPLIALGLLTMAACTDDAATDAPAGTEPPVATEPVE